MSSFESIFSFRHVSHRHIALHFDVKTALGIFIRLSMSMKLLVFNWTLLRKPSQKDLASSVSISTFCPSLDNSKLRISSISAGTDLSRKSLLISEIRFFSEHILSTEQVR